MCLCTREPSQARMPDPVWVELSPRLGGFDGFRDKPAVCEASIQMEGAPCSTIRAAKQKPLEVAKWDMYPTFCTSLGLAGWTGLPAGVWPEPGVVWKRRARVWAGSMQRVVGDFSRWILVISVDVTSVVIFHQT